jgi:hypothetical protein
MKSSSSRRQFLQTAALSLPALASLPSPAAEGAKSGAPFSFVLLGDLHLDKLEHHDMQWMRQNKPDDIRQVENYSRISRDVHPKLFSTVRETIADLNQRPETRTAFTLQVGDFVEGLCGTEKLAHQHCEEGLSFVRTAQLPTPFVFTKGNHDVTGPGAVEAYNHVLIPFLREQTARGFSAEGSFAKACFTVRQGESLFAFFDAYDAATSLAWLEAVLAKRTERHAFVVIHPPVVPYGARSTWHIFSNDKQRAQRTRLLELLGQQQVFVLGGHIHKFNSLVRATAKGRFLQLAVSSILSSPEVKARDVLSGVKDYTPEQIHVEPSYGKGTETERRVALESEAPFVKQFEYADLPGYAVVRVNGESVQADIFAGASRIKWKMLDLTASLKG